MARLDEAAMLSDRLEPDHVLRFKTRWRLAKAHHDQERPSDALTALDPLVEAGDPFAGYPQGLDAVGALAVEAWHRLGYADPRVDRLFVAAEAVHQATGDRVRATQARLQRLWASACRGDGDAVRAELQAFVELDPGSFESGPSRHPRAPDAAGSVAWLQLDAARTALRVATWARDPELADLAEDAFEDAATDADLDREGEIWFLEPIALVRRRLARPDPDDYARTWLDLAGRIDYPRRAYHHRVALAEAARGDDPSRLATRYREAADVALEHDHGPEWAIDALVEAAEPERARELVERYGVDVFAPTLSDTSAT